MRNPPVVKAAKRPATIDEYLAPFPTNVRKALNRLRKQIHEAVPGCTEVISYAMPGFHREGIIVWFAGYGGHCALYARPDILDQYPRELKGYRKTKSAVHFTPDSPIPAPLVRKIVRAVLAVNLEKAEARRMKKKAGRTSLRKSVKSTTKKA